MSKSHKDPLSKPNFKKPKSNHNNIDSYLKNQQKEKTQLKIELQTAISHAEQLNSLIVEKNKMITKLEKSIQEREAEIQKCNNDINVVKEKNVKTLQDFSYFKDNFYQLEELYDQTCQRQNQEIIDLKAQLQKLKSDENQKIQELSLTCQDLTQQLHDKTQSSMQLNEHLLETLHNFEKIKQDFLRQQNDFENYKKQVEIEKKIYDENNNLEFAKLKNELIHKDEMIQKIMLDKQNMEKEANRIIEDLNYKIRRIERAFSQPTKVVAPMVSSTPNNNNTKYVTTPSPNVPEISNDNVAITRPQVREPLETQSHPLQTPVNNANEKPDNSIPQPRQYKFKRPSHIQPTGSHNTTASTSNNRKRRQPAKKTQAYLNLPTTAIHNEFSTSSNDESDDDSVLHRPWRPNKPRDECIVPDTSDASEGFAKPKRSKK